MISGTELKSDMIEILNQNNALFNINHVSLVRTRSNSLANSMVSRPSFNTDNNQSLNSENLNKTPSNSFVDGYA
jgi:hypothetical protein